MEWLTDWVNLGPIVGILVSLLGFSAAIWQIRRSTGAVQAARDAVKETTQSMVRSQFLVGVTRALERVQEIRTLYSGLQWAQVLYRYPDLWITLNQIRVQHPRLNDEERTKVQKLIDRLQANERKLEKSVRLNSQPSKPEGDVVALQSVQSTLSELSGSLQ